MQTLLLSKQIFMKRQVQNMQRGHGEPAEILNRFHGYIIVFAFQDNGIDYEI